MSMYDKMMSLPLLHGANPELIRSFLEKSHLDFKTFEEGETIVSVRDTCRTLRCLLSGSARVVHPLFNGRLLLAERIVEGAFIGVEHLFGMDNAMRMSVTALGRCGTMELSKPQYLQLLRSDNIFLMNCLNYLSRSAQKCEEGLGKSHASCCSFIQSLIDAFTQRHSDNIMLCTPKQAFIDFLADELPKTAESVESLADKGLIGIVDAQTIAVPDRQLLLDHDG